MAKRHIQDWELTYTDWDPQQQSLREALCALGNGYLVTRGAFEEVHAGGPHYPGTYLAGGYNPPGKPTSPAMCWKTSPW